MSASNFSHSTREEPELEPKLSETNNKSPIKNQFCILDESKPCENCCECYICDLDPNKLCDNCAECLNVDYPCAVTAARKSAQKPSSHNASDIAEKK